MNQNPEPSTPTKGSTPIEGNKNVDWPSSKTVISTATIGNEIASTVNNIQATSPYAPNLEDFQSWVTGGKILYRGLMEFLLHKLPQLKESIDIAKGLLNDEMTNKPILASIRSLTYPLIKHPDFQEIQPELNLIHTLSMREMITYKGTNYSILSVPIPPWFYTDVEKFFYLLSLIKKVNPEFLSLNHLK